MDEQITNMGVYRVDHACNASTFLVALLNDDEGDYSVALAHAVPIPGAGFTYDDSEFMVFIGRAPEDGLYTTYHDPRRLYEGRKSHDLIDTGLLAVSPSELRVKPKQSRGMKT